MHVHIYRLTRSKGENSFYRTLSENEWKISSAEYHDETGWKSRRARKSSLVDALFHGVLFCVFQSPGKLIVRSYPEVVLFIPTASSSRQCKILFFKILSSPLCVMISLVLLLYYSMFYSLEYTYTHSRDLHLIYRHLLYPLLYHIYEVILFMRFEAFILFLSLSLLFRLRLTIPINYPT